MIDKAIRAKQFSILKQVLRIWISSQHYRNHCMTLLIPSSMERYVINGTSQCLTYNWCHCNAVISHVWDSLAHSLPSACTQFRIHVFHSLESKSSQFSPPFLVWGRPVELHHPRVMIVPRHDASISVFGKNASRCDFLSIATCWRISIFSMFESS